MKKVTLNVKKLTKKLILRALRQLYAASVINNSYMVGHATFQCEIPQVDFLQMINFLTMHFSSKQLFSIVMIYYKIFKNT